MATLRFNTIDSPEYRYFPITKKKIRLSVTAAHDARIALRTHLNEDSNVYEIVIGGWGNKMSTIKRNSSDSDVVEAETESILSSEAQRDFCIKWWCDGLLEVICQNFGDVRMRYKDNDPFVVNFIGFSTAWGARGEWILEHYTASLPAVRTQLAATCNYWIDCNSDEGLPRNAVSASDDGLYIGRARHSNTITPGSVRERICSLSWGGSTHHKKEFQILCHPNVGWVRSWQGSVPLYALPGGETEDSYALFVGRVLHENIYYIGKIQPNHQVCYIPLNEGEVAFTEYEVLVIDEDAIEYIGR
ncbi:uncharacterized protein LOC107220859 isoform X1 [Neodiprion lecontei]|uniref:Uncharacterized protein LOC107220859 isoform X1 n=2 Tax=Neodiprion lecontei TaxID=441921 RepID=A0A6J0BK98_NEOLC|nr:uncharacterized protein LOC107220859 isoform X1 [Neodiprion lecontei]